MNGKRNVGFTFAAILAMAVVSTVVTASPLFSIGDGGDRTWQQAIDDGNLRAVDPNVGDVLTFPATIFYPSQTPGFELVPSVITAVGPVELDPDAGGILPPESFDSLEMDWDSDSGIGPGDLSIAGWEYVYDADPDLTGMMAHFSIGIPPVVDMFGNPVIDPMTGLPIPAIWDVSFELIDINFNARSWFWPMPAVGWHQEWLTLDLQASQGNFSFFGETPGFDITMVTSIRLDVAGTQAIFPILPSSLSLGNWNVWNSLTIVPEPSSVTLAVMGAIGWLLFWLRRRRVGQTA